MKPSCSKATRSAEEKPDSGRSNYSTERSPRTSLLRAAKEAVVLPVVTPAPRAEAGCGGERAVQE
jgi:hypothetical protein